MSRGSQPLTIAGAVYALAGATDKHNTIVGNGRGLPRQRQVACGPNPGGRFAQSTENASLNCGTFTCYKALTS